MIHFFDSDIAKEYGIEEAIILSNLNFWISKNKANNRHFYKERYWTYNSQRAFAELFPYMSEKKIYRIISSLKDKGLIISDNFNENKYDRTNWYALSDEGNALFINDNSITRNDNFHFPKSSDRSNENIPPIPDNKPDSNFIYKPDNKNLTKEIEIFEKFRLSYFGTKRGLTVELKEMQKHKDWFECLDLLQPALDREIKDKEKRKKDKVFVPQWKNLATWIKQRCWEQEFAVIDNDKLEFERESDGKYNDLF